MAIRSSSRSGGGNRSTGVRGPASRGAGTSRVKAFAPSRTGGGVKAATKTAARPAAAKKGAATASARSAPTRSSVATRRAEIRAILNRVHRTLDETEELLAVE